MLIAGAELEGSRIADVRITHGRVTEIGALAPHPDQEIVQANGRLLLPGLHDHHIHVAALAAARASVQCGPPAIMSPDALARALTRPGQGWLRGIGYHESVAGMLDRTMLDRIVPDRPVRVQHRSGRMWFLNSAALDCLAGHAPPAGLDRATGRLFDEDAWLRRVLAGSPPGFAEVGAMLARRGITGLTEISPGNDNAMARHFAAEQARGTLPQRVLLAGRLDLDATAIGSKLRLGPAKLHLHEADLPDFDEAVGFFRAAHAQGRAAAVHCATEVELVFTLAALAEAGVQRGDRIEHASVTPDTALADITAMGLAVVSQPHFIAERGDAYRRDVAPGDRPLLYRLRAFHDSGVTLAAGSDAPYGDIDPWAAMAAAVSRRTRDGHVIGPDEALSPEQALDLYLADPEDLTKRRRVEPGAPADLCLIDRNWAAARRDLAEVGVDRVWIDGRPVFDRVDQPPVECGPCADPPA